MVGLSALRRLVSGLVGVFMISLLLEVVVEVLVGTFGAVSGCKPIGKVVVVVVCYSGCGGGGDTRTDVHEERSSFLHQLSFVMAIAREAKKRLISVCVTLPACPTGLMCLLTILPELLRCGWGLGRTGPCDSAKHQGNAALP